jgi:hemolysin activation/secretion protein
MKIAKIKLSVFFVICTINFLIYSASAAQKANDAGALINEIERDQKKLEPLKSAPKPEEKVLEKPVLQGPKFKIKHFIFKGNQVLEANILELFLKDYLNKEISLDELKAAVNSISLYYKDKGYIADATLPKQDITDGDVTINITEAIFGGVKLNLDENTLYHVKPEIIKNFIELNNPKNSPLNIDKLDRSVIIANELPGIEVKENLLPGEIEGQTLDSVKLINKPWILGQLSADNYGSRTTGPVRYLLYSEFNSPLRVGDKLEVIYLHSSGSDYEKLGYEMPIGYSGLRAGINGSMLKYNVVENDVSGSKGYGTANSAQASLNYPLYRTKETALSLSSYYEYKFFANFNETGPNPGQQSEYNTHTVNIGSTATQINHVLYGGQTTAVLDFSMSDVNYGLDPTYQSVQSSLLTGGRVNRFLFNTAHSQFIKEDISLTLKANGQWADGNLDSSQKIYLGGASGVRAFPANEASGSKGFIINLEARKALPMNFNVLAFYDYGSARQYVETNQSVVITGPNTVTLQGYGFGLDYSSPYDTNFSIMASRRLVNNPNKSSLGTDSDGSHPGNFYWFKAFVNF